MSTPHQVQGFLELHDTRRMHAKGAAGHVLSYLGGKVGPHVLRGKVIDRCESALKVRVASELVPDREVSLRRPVTVDGMLSSQILPGTDALLSCPELHLVLADTGGKDTACEKYLLHLVLH